MFIVQENQPPQNLTGYFDKSYCSEFDTKVTEYLCSGWVFFSPDKFRLFN